MQPCNGDLGRMAAETVECHSGHAYGERPVAFHWQGHRYRVTSIEARWRVPGGHGFRVLTEENRLFELFYDETLDQWQIREP